MDSLRFLAQEPGVGCSRVARTHFVTGSFAQKSPAHELPMKSQVVSHTFSGAKTHTFSQHLHNIHTAFPIKNQESAAHSKIMCEIR